MAGLGISAVTSAAGGLGSAMGVGLVSQMEQTRASFMAFTKDSALTESILADVRSEAAKTPFAFQEMATATASLLPVSKASGQGLMDLVKQAEVLAASNPMQGLEGASFALREAMTGDFTSIIERFNLSRSTINQLKEEGVSNFEIIGRAMQEMGFDADLIAAKAETLEGRWSTFQDTLDTVKMQVATPIFDALKDGLVGLQGALDENMDSIQGFASGLASGLKGAIQSGMQWLKSMTEALRPFVDAFMRAWPEIQRFLELLQSGFEIVVEAVQAVIGGDFKGALGLMMNELAEVGGAIGEQLGEWAQMFLSWIGPMIPPFLEQLQELAGELVDWVLAQVPPLVEQLATWAGAFIEWVGPQIPPLLRELGHLIEAGFNWIVDQLPGIMERLAEWGKAFIEWVAPRIGPLLIELGKLLLELTGWILTTAVPKVIEAHIQMGRAFVDWIADEVLPNLPGALATVAASIAGWIAATAPQVGAWALELGAELVRGFLSGMASLTLDRAASTLGFSHGGLKKALARSGLRWADVRAWARPSWEFLGPPLAASMPEHGRMVSLVQLPPWAVGESEKPPSQQPESREYAAERRRRREAFVDAVRRFGEVIAERVSSGEYHRYRLEVVLGWTGHRMRKSERAQFEAAVDPKMALAGRTLLQDLRALSADAILECSPWFRQPVQRLIGLPDPLRPLASRVAEPFVHELLEFGFDKDQWAQGEWHSVFDASTWPATVEAEANQSWGDIVTRVRTQVRHPVNEAWVAALLAAQALLPEDATLRRKVAA